MPMIMIVMIMIMRMPDPGAAHVMVMPLLRRAHRVLVSDDAGGAIYIFRP